MSLLNDICSDENITVLRFTEELGQIFFKNPNTISQGLSAVQKDKKYIIYDSTAQTWERRFIIAHELAHHLFGHLRPNTSIKVEDREKEANIFASVLVAMMLFEEYKKQ
jgi:Zn-dependent peptidase ImmA (M78 family)